MEQDEHANERIQEINPEFVAPLMALSINDQDAYPKSMLAKSVTNVQNGGEYWERRAPNKAKITVQS